MPTTAFTRLKRLLFLLISFFFFSSVTAQQNNGNPCDASTTYLYWTGEVNSDFFNENNWRMAFELPASPTVPDGMPDTPPKPSCLPGSSSFPYSICLQSQNLSIDKHPQAGSLDPGVPVRYNLLIDSADVTANGNILFACAQKGMTLRHTRLTITGGTLQQGVLSLMNESTVHLGQGGVSAGLILNFLDAASWVYLHRQNPDQLMPFLANVYINNVTGVIDNNFRVNQYYQEGAVVRPLSASFAAMTLYSGTNQQGSSGSLNEDIIYRGSSLPGGMENTARSFILKRGFMATLAVNTNGTGKSRVFIASEEDLVLDALDAALQGNVRFARVVPWNWVTKKGTGGFYDQLNAGWFYNWALNNNPQPNYEYVPMTWGASATTPASLNQIIGKKKTTHTLGFNESDNCNDQSGQFNNLCQPAVAVAYYENLMGLGVRLGTPAPRENGPTTWLKEFAQIAKEKNVRFDFVAVHWYDWGSNPANSPNADPQQIFNRFKAYLENVHTLYQLPIWITEFNANPNRGNAIQAAFLNLALPYLESLSYVERYAYFQPNPNNAQNPVEPAYFLDDNGGLTNIGQLYKDHTSTPSVTPSTYVCPNNLDGLDAPYVPPVVNTTVFEAECGKYIGNQWNVLENADASNGIYIRGNNSLPGVTALAKQVHFEFDLQEAGTYRVYIRSASSGGNGAIRIRMDGNDFEQISPFNSGSFTWFQVPRFYDLGPGIHRLSLEYPNANILLDQVALTNGQEDLESSKKDAGFCVPSALKWGLDASDYLGFHEAESAAKGINWTTETSANAIGGAYVKSADNITSDDIPEGTDKVISLSFNLDKTDEYEMWAKIQAITPGENSLWIAVDDEPFRKWNNLENTNYEWYWKKFHFSYGTEDRAFSFFLAAGLHTVKLAIASGHVSVDRVAVATKGKLPETTDPNVLLLGESLEFEAETAKLLGGATVVNCVNSSNGKQVNMGTNNSNGVRFEEIVAESAGPYKLKVSYMSAVTRSFRVFVNGVNLGQQTPPVSGAWCFNGGSPAIYEIAVTLNRGINVIDITPFSGDAPFIDKIKLEKADLNGLELEAESAELIGGSSVVNCVTASNGALVNPFSSVSNGIRFNNLLADVPKTYLVDIHYLTAVDRSIRVSLNGQSFVTQSFTSSGDWCFNGGSPKVKTIQLDFIQGMNSIEMRPTGSNAPFIDKIVIREPDNATTSNTTTTPVAGNLSLNQETAENEKGFGIYPNPVRAGTSLRLSLRNSSYRQGQIMVLVTDMTGKTIYSVITANKPVLEINLDHGLSRGMFIVSILQGSTKTNKKIIVQ